MRNKSAAVQGGRGSRQSKSAADVPDVIAAATISSTTRVGLLAPGGPAVLPPLDEVRSRYSFYTGKKALFKLCQNLVEEGLATTRSWETSKADPLAFIDESLRRWCFLHGLSRIEAEFSEFSFAIRDADAHQLRVSVQHWHLGHFVCRAPLTALEEHVSGLGAAFYQLLAYTLVRSLGSWDLDDAAASVEQMREWANESREEEGGTGDEFEIPDLDGCTPTFIAEARKNHVSIQHSLRILRAHSKGRCGVWIKSLLRMYALSCIPIDKRLKQDPEEEGYDYLRPVPAAVLSFDEQDAVVATVDEELENWSQCSSPPLLNLKFDPFQPREMREVWRILRINYEIALETASLAEKWRLWTEAEEKKKNEHRHRNRGNSAVELRKAVMIYTGTQAYVTVHDVLRDEQGRPHYGPPEALSADFLKSLCELLKQKAVREAEILPNNILCLTDELIAWWCSTAVRPMFFQSATDQDANALSGRMFPHPPLMFVATETHISVRALPTNDRPASGTQLLSAPYWNTYEDGSVCTGSMRVPTSEVSCSIIEEWERGFFESAFTHPSGAVRLTSYKGGIIPMWTSVLGRDAFPDQYLVPAHETLLQFIRRCQK